MKGQRSKVKGERAGGRRVEGGVKGQRSKVKGGRLKVKGQT